MFLNNNQIQIIGLKINEGNDTPKEETEIFLSMICRYVMDVLLTGYLYNTKRIEMQPVVKCMPGIWRM